LINSCYFGYYHIAKYLIEQGANVHAQESQALIDACFKGHLKIVMLLLENNVDIHARNNEALYKSMKRGRSSIVKYLLFKGANINDMKSITNRDFNDCNGSIIDYEDQETFQVISPEYCDLLDIPTKMCDKCDRISIEYESKCVICDNYCYSWECLCNDNFNICASQCLSDELDSN
jgi:hypothetical protein